MSLASLTFHRKAYGSEPKPAGSRTIEPIGKLELIRLLNWYNACKETDDAKQYVLDMFPDRAKEISKVDPFELRSMGWTFRMVSRGFHIDSEIIEKLKKQLDTLIEKATKPKEEDVVSEAKLDDYRANTTENFLTDVKEMLEHKFDISYIKKYVVSQINWLKSKDTAGAKKALDRYYRFAEKHPLLANLENAKPEVVRKPRKPRKKKIKSPEVIAKSFNYKEDDTTLGLKSLKPTAIIGVMEVWTYNTEKRLLTRYVSKDKPLEIKGTTILNYDEKLSGTKKVRKPEVILPMLMSQTKVGTRKVFESIKAVASEPSSRTSKETLILKVYK